MRRNSAIILPSLLVLSVLVKYFETSLPGVVCGGTRKRPSKFHGIEEREQQHSQLAQGNTCGRSVPMC